MDLVQPLIISDFDFTPFRIPFQKPFTFAGNTVKERVGFYLNLKTSNGLLAQGEAAPLEGISKEAIRRVKHDLAEIRPFLMGLKIPCQKDELLGVLKAEPYLFNSCASVRFAVESAILMLASRAVNKSIAEFLDAELVDVQTAVLLQGTHQDVISDFKYFSKHGARVFKLKVGDRNIALDVKKVQDIRPLLEQDSYLRLDGNRVWNLKEACVFAQLAGNQNIDFIEEPISDIGQLNDFYQQTHMRMALDESLASSSVTRIEGVTAFVLKPMILGLIPTLDWIEKAASTNRKAIISSAFESPVGFKVLANLACLSGQVAGLGTERWFKNVNPIVGDDGMIDRRSLI
jgi:o-succinylbenzoate synthase